jgi:homocysteine S-methyltransferase
MFQSKVIFENNPFNNSNKDFKPLILDGAMGSYLQEKGFKPDNASWMTSINKKNPEIIIQVHKDYIEAGANIITTNTFRTNPVSAQDYEKNIKSNVKQAVQLAIEASKDYNIYIAGSNAPAEDCYQKERTISNKILELNHKYHIDLLIDNKVHFILNETQSHLDEIKIICNHCSKNDIPYVISLYISESENILSGESLEYVVKFILDNKPLAIGLNCIPTELFLNLREQVSSYYYWGYYLNCGSGNPTDRIITCGVSPDDYIETVKESMVYNPSFVGSCCGSNPNHIKKIREYLDGRN